jgi:two-component sensor histidine kinase
VRIQSLPIDQPIDAIVAGGIARRFAIEHFAEPRFAATFAIVAAELASNMAHHSAGGVLRLERTADAFVIEAHDRGGAPGIRGRRGLGIGEGAVGRLSDRVEVRIGAGGGREVRAVLLWREART